MSENIEFNGYLVKNIFYNKDNYFNCSLVSYQEERSKTIVVTGNFLPLKAKALYKFTGKYVEHKKYGPQFNAESCEEVFNEDNDGRIIYLSGDNFPGIGEKTAAKLIKDLGDNLFEKINEDPSCLDNLSYLTAKRRQVLIDGASKAVNDEESQVRFFLNNNLKMRQISLLKKMYGDKARRIASEDPYGMVYNVNGISFEIADKFAMALGYHKDDIQRLSALIYDLVNKKIFENGSSYLEEEEVSSLFVKEAFEYSDLYSQALDNLFHLGYACHEDDRIYPKIQFESENYIADYLSIFPEIPLPEIPDDRLEESIEYLERSLNIAYDDTQIEAVKTFFKKDFLILTGGPGTGKSTIVKAIYELAKMVYPTSTIALLAPTGRAAKRLKDLTDHDARTIHSYLGYDMESGKFNCNENNPVTGDILIVDEFSMVDTYVFASLLRAGVYFKKILLIGDEDQLPSVSPGQVLSDLLKTNLFPVVRLKNIYRQKDGSGIIELAHDIAEGNEINLKEDVLYIPCDTYGLKEKIQKLVSSYLERGYSDLDVQVMAPKYNGQSGIDNLNRILQATVNPKEGRKREAGNNRNSVYRINDKILQLKNRPDDHVYNGDIGVLSGILSAKEAVKGMTTLQVDFGSHHIVEYTAEDYDNITHAFCVSVHKAQGCEFPVVILPCLKEYGIMLQKRLLYTAVTRAEKELVIMGDLELFKQACLRQGFYSRKTTLAERLNEKC